MKIVATNKRARYDYEITQKLLAGIVLSGAEVKSVKNGAISLKGSFVSFKANEAYLINAHITPYKQASNTASYDPTASRKLLLNRKEIDSIAQGVQSEGMTVVPIAVGVSRGLIKVEIGVGRGKKLHDKRQTIKKRDMLRDIDRDVKSPKNK